MSIEKKKANKNLTDNMTSLDAIRNVYVQKASDAGMTNSKVMRNIPVVGNLPLLRAPTLPPTPNIHQNPNLRI